jgi:hypothetical protein
MADGRQDSQRIFGKRLLAAPSLRTHPIGRARSMRASILQRIFRRVQISRSEGIVLDAILSKANMFGKHARVAYECLAAITGFSIRHVKRLVKSLIFERRLLRVYKRVLWPGHNAINVYDVVIPWRKEVNFEEMGACLPTGKIGRAYPRQDRVNNKGDMACHPNTNQEEKSPCKPARLCTEQEASGWFSHGSDPWYFAQGLTPPAKEAEKARVQG